MYSSIILDSVILSKAMSLYTKIIGHLLCHLCMK